MWPKWAIEMSVNDSIKELLLNIESLIGVLIFFNLFSRPKYFTLEEPKKDLPPSYINFRVEGNGGLSQK